MEYYFLTHHKCGSGWFNSIHFDLFLRLGWSFGIVNTIHDFVGLETINQHYHSKGYALLSYNNADAKHFDFDTNFKAIHVVRDPRDIIISAYFSHKKTHPLWGADIHDHRAKLNNLSIGEGIKLELDFSSQFLEPMRSWLNKGENILNLKLEDISKSPVENYIKILNHFDVKINSKSNVILEDILGLERKAMLKVGREFNSHFLKLVEQKRTVSLEFLKKVLKKNSFERKSGGRSRGTENINSHYRKGTAGDWKNYFDADITTLFKEKYNDLVLGYGYEKSLMW